MSKSKVSASTLASVGSIRFINVFCRRDLSESQIGLVVSIFDILSTSPRGLKLIDVFRNLETRYLLSPSTIVHTDDSHNSELAYKASRHALHASHL